MDARFDFDKESRALVVALRVRSAAGPGSTAIERREIHALSKHNMTISIDLLEYTLEFTEYAVTEDFVQRREQYMVDSGGSVRGRL